MLNTRFSVLVCITLTAAAARLIPHPSNVTPIAAMALFGGAYFASKRAAFAVPLAAMLLSDLILGLVLYGPAIFRLMPYVLAAAAAWRPICFTTSIKHGRSPFVMPSIAVCCPKAPVLLLCLPLRFRILAGQVTATRPS